MSRRERTLQQLDPLAALIGRPTSYAAAVGIPLYAVAVTWIHRDDIRTPILSLIAITLSVMCGLILVRESSPLRAPLRRRTLVLIVLLSALALAASAGASWTNNEFVTDDWGASAIGLYLVALAPYRPTREIALAGVAAAVFSAGVAFAELKYFVTDGPEVAFLIVATTPVLALSLASATFADGLVRSLDRWSERTSTAFRALGRERNESIARSVQQDRVTIMNKEIVPFLASLTDGGEVTAETRERAREIANRARSIMVAQADRTWLETLAEQSARIDPSTGLPARATIHDPSRLARHMTADERTAVRAVLSAINNSVSFRPGESALEIVSEMGRCAVTVRADMASPERALHGELAPYLAVLAVVFSDLLVDNDSTGLTLRFSYEQR